MRRKILTITLSVMVLFFTFSLNTLAANPPQRQVVFLLDASGSMQQNDPNRLAVDGINQMLSSMLTDVDVGFVAFNDAVSEVVPLTGHANRGKVTQKVSAVKYIGYTNAGDALQTAVDLFTDSSDTGKYIVILSDGEIAMKTPEATAQSLVEYGSAIAAAKEKGIAIFTIGLEDELADVNNSIFDAAKQSGGKTYYAPTAGDLQNTINTILWEDLGFRKQAVA